MEQKVSQISLDKLKENNQNDIKFIYNNIESLLVEPKVIEYLKPNKGLTDILKNFKYKVKLGQIKTILHTNIFITLNVVNHFH